MSVLCSKLRYMGVRNPKTPQCCGVNAARSKITYHEAGERFRRGLVVVDSADTTLATRVEVEKPKRFILVLFNYRNAQNRTRSAGRSVSEARVETIDGDVRIMSRDTRTTERRLSCSVVPTCDWKII